MSFKTELEMSGYFRSFISGTFEEENIIFLEECKGLFGIPDYLFFEKNENSLQHVVAVELKLKNWKKALKQAFKYRNFANQSFVIVDEKHIKVVLKNLDEFVHFNIGLASFNKGGQLKIYYCPETQIPFSPYYISKVKNKVFPKNKEIEDGFSSFNNLNKKSMLSSRFKNFDVSMQISHCC